MRFANKSLSNILAADQVHHKRARTIRRKVDFDDWEDVPAVQRLDVPLEPERVYFGGLLILGRGFRPVQVFQALLPPCLIRQLVGSDVAVEDVYRYFGLVVLLHGAFVPTDPVLSGSHVEREVYLTMRRILIEEHLLADHNVFGWDKFKRLQKQLLIPLQFARNNLSTHWAGLLTQFGETVALDEMMRSYLGNSPHRRFCPNKPEPIGHWTTQLSTMLEDVNLPFCFGLFPWDAGSGSIELMTVWKWVQDLLGMNNSRSIVVCDAYYMSQPVLSYLMDNNIKFLSSVSPQRFKPLTKRLSQKVLTQGDTAVIRCENTDVFMVHHWDLRTSIGRKFVMTNSFVVKDVTEEVAGPHPIYVAYNHTFSTCDLFNRKLHKFKYPFRRMSWEANFDSLFVSVLLVNACSAWHYCNSKSTEKVSMRRFCHILGLELIKNPNIVIPRRFQ